jgi:UDP-N-acetylglucosamine--N-acetylmuramyl-(pentapeptide) pyrophosphoryl-undecaprenol N-acetylglucosamine transferase
VRFAAIHQTGKGRAADVAAEYGRRAFPVETVSPVEFVDDMAKAYADADLIVARAGAMTIAEIAASGRPAVLVPFAGATHGHQEANARALESAGAAMVLAEHDANEETMGRAIAALLSDPARLAAMGDAARKSAKPDAAARLCEIVFEAEASPS